VLLLLGGSRLTRPHASVSSAIARLNDAPASALVTHTVADLRRRLKQLQREAKRGPEPEPEPMQVDE
jgi:hypothetical protein